MRSAALRFLAAIGGGRCCSCLGFDADEDEEERSPLVLPQEGQKVLPKQEAGGVSAMQPDSSTASTTEPIMVRSSSEEPEDQGDEPKAPFIGLSMSSKNLGIASSQGPRASQEDLSLVWENLLPGITLLVTLDGHTGCEAATMTANLLPGLIQKAAPWNLEQDVSESLHESWNSKFREIFEELDQVVGDEVSKLAATNHESDMSSGVVLALALVTDRRALFASLGDVRSGIVDDGKLESLFDRDLHRATNLVEMERLVAAGMEPNAEGRAWGLEVSRSVGDWQPDADGYWRKPPGMLSQPAILCVEFKASTYAIVLASDGADLVADQELGIDIRAALRDPQTSPEAAAGQVVAKADERKTLDNSLVLVYMVRRPPAIERGRSALRGLLKPKKQATEQTGNDATTTTATAATNAMESDAGPGPEAVGAASSSTAASPPATSAAEPTTATSATTPTVAEADP